MEIQPVVVGTAGHIDHGKSTLVRALTGIDPDRLKEEKERGLTIDLGFANFALPDGRRVGIVDVPGHERFIRNMVAGASGIDLVVLVVAADDGVMPQTREHLQIMELLGVRRGLTALTKVDMVDAELVDLAEEDVRELLADTFLGEAPILRVSAITGQGMDALVAELHRLASEAPARSAEGVFRMPIQRVFTKRGFGTVLTGIPVSGEVSVGDVVEVQPGGARGKVRGIQAYGGKTDRARAGHSSALNVSDVDHHDVERGRVVAAPGFFRPVRMIGARLTALRTLDRPVTNRMRIRLHTGTADPAGEVIVLDREEIGPGESGLVQLRLDDPLVAAPGDAFVLRHLTPAFTLGGGVILEESRHRLKRFKRFVLDELSEQEASLESPAELLEATLRRYGAKPQSADELAVEIKRSRAETERLVEELAAAGKAAKLGRGGKASGWMHARTLDERVDDVVSTVEAWFAEHPHRQVADARDLRSAIGWEQAFFNAVLDEAAARERLAVEPGGRVRAAGREVELDPETAAACARVVAALEAGGFQPPTPAELGGRDVGRVLEVLVDQGRAHRVAPDLFLADGPIRAAREAIVANCEQNGHLVIPELRDRLGTTRKFLIPLLEHFDAQGLTIRQGANRVLKRR